MSNGEMAYNIYAEEVENKNYRNEPMPKWKNLPKKIQKAWEKTATKLLEYDRWEQWKNTYNGEK